MYGYQHIRSGLLDHGGAGVDRKALLHIICTAEQYRITLFFQNSPDLQSDCQIQVGFRELLTG